MEESSVGRGIRCSVVRTRSIAGKHQTRNDDTPIPRSRNVYTRRRNVAFPREGPRTINVYLLDCVDHDKTLLSSSFADILSSIGRTSFSKYAPDNGLIRNKGRLVSGLTHGTSHAHIDGVIERPNNNNKISTQNAFRKRRFY